MNVRYIVMDTADLNGIVPDWVCRIASRDDVMLYGNFDEDNNDELVAFILYQSMPTLRKGAAIRYLFVSENYRGIRIGKELLSDSLKLLKNANINIVYGKYIGDKKEADQFKRFMARTGFYPITLNGQYISYSLEQMLDSTFKDQLEHMESFLGNAFERKEITNIEMNSFREKLIQENIMYDFHDPQIKFNLFYKKDGKILGNIIVKEIDKKCLLLSDYYIEKTENQGIILPTLLGCLLNKMEQIYEKDTMLNIELFSNSYINGIRKLFGEELQAGVINEYVKKM